MRVLAVTPYYEPEGGGLERYAHALLRRLAARGHEVRALAFTRGPPRREDLDGVAVERLRPRWRLSNTPLDPGFGRLVARRLRQQRPDVLWAHTPVPFPAEVATAAARRAGVPTVVTYHAGALEGGRPLLDLLAALDRATFERAMLRGASRLVAVSPFVRDRVLAGHGVPVEVVPPGVDADVFRPGLSPPERPTVLFVGPLDRAYRWKGLDVLWDAFARVRRRVPEARLALVGAGDRVPELRARAAREGLAGAVELRGRLPLPQLVRAYQEASLVALPSTSPAESFGMVLAEGNACGRPAVGSRVGGIPDFVRPGVNGLLAEPGDAASLADALEALLLDPDLAARLGAEGRRRVVAEHGWDDLAARMERVLAEAAGLPDVRVPSEPRKGMRAVP